MHKLLLIISLTVACGIKAQDRLFFTNGSSQTGIITSMTKDFVFFRLKDSSAVRKVNKSDLVMVEDYKGLRYLFAKQELRHDSLLKNPSSRQNLLGIQPLGIFAGRIILCYERFTKDGRIGWMIPLTLTFDPLGTLYSTKLDTNQNRPKRISGVNFIGGLDINFYIGKSERAKFFIGPRFRYGTDQFLRGTEAYTFQTQLGWKYGGNQKKFIQHLSMGFGFVRVLSSPGGNLINSRESYPWFSLNYRLGIRW